jgi:Membrane proteins related to metalloendopeptidases
MTGFRNMRRMKKVWEQTTRYFRRSDSQDLKEKADQAAPGSVISIPIWRKKSVRWIGGAVIVLAAAGIIGAQQYSQYVERNTFEIFHVYKDGQQVGTVGSPEEVAKLTAELTAEIQQANPGIQMVLDTGDITYESENAFKAVPDTEATLAKLEGMFTSHAIGVEVVIDGKVVGIVKDKETADSILARVQSKFAPELAAAAKEGKVVSTLSLRQDEADNPKAAEEEPKPGRTLTEVQFLEEVKLDNVNIDPSKIADSEEIYKKIVTGSTKPTKYTVQKGDCIGCIAQKFDISPQVIYENNPWIEGDRITVGDELDLTVQRPELTVRTVENLVEMESIAPPVEIVKNDQMREGQTKTIKEGVEGKQQLTYRIVKENGYVVMEELIDKQVIEEPVAKVVEKGTMVVVGEGTGKFAMPVKNYRITSKYGKRWGRMHNGIDLIGNKSIYASDAGTVVHVGWKSGLGNTVIIDHKNGYKTVYGHLRSYKVDEGDKVEKGDVIAIMGNTGNSTGTHLHFEIHKDGVIQNPLKYL